MKKEDGRKNNGGPGRNQGRKPLPYLERKTAINVFVKNKHIKKKGGLKAAKELVLSVLETD